MIEHFFDILTVPIQKVATLAGFDVEAALGTITRQPCSDIRRYPDGSLQIGTTWRILESFWKTGYSDSLCEVLDLLPQDAFLSQGSPKQSCSIFTLPHFSPISRFMVTCFARFVIDWPDGHMSISTSYTHWRTREQRPLPRTDSIPVTIVFRRRLTAKMRDQLVQLLARWAASVRRQGVFGDGPMLIPDNRVEWFDRRAQFTLDVSRSGQYTLNWLILCLVSYSYINVIFDISFLTRDLVDEEYGPSRGKLSVAEIPELPDSDGSDCCLWHLGDPEFDELAQCWSERHSPATQVAREQKVASDIKELLTRGQAYRACLEDAYFEFIEDDDASFDCLEITIQLEDDFRTDGQREYVMQSLHDWLQMGYNGGFGDAFHYASSPLYDQEHSCLTMWCDMGTANVVGSARSLVIVLDSWRACRVIVRSVRFGRRHVDE